MPHRTTVLNTLARAAAAAAAACCVCTSHMRYRGGAVPYLRRPPPAVRTPHTRGQDDGCSISRGLTATAPPAAAPTQRTGTAHPHMHTPCTASAGTRARTQRPRTQRLDSQRRRSGAWCDRPHAWGGRSRLVRQITPGAADHAWCGRAPPPPAPTLISCIAESIDCSDETHASPSGSRVAPLSTCG